MDCIFCKIAKGELPSSKVYEDDDFIAILDLFPITKGHTLLIPKKHHVNIFDQPEDTGAKVYPVLAKLARAIKTATGAEGLNIMQNNGEVAGQVVFHSHIHLFPRSGDDGIKISATNKTKATDEYMADYVKKITGALS